MPTASGIGALRPLASQAAQLYASAESALAALASATSPSSGDVASAEQALATVYTVLQLLLANAQQISPASVTGSDVQLLQNLRAQLPPILEQLGAAITQLGPSTNGTPSIPKLQSVTGLLANSGAIGQAVSSVIQPVVSLSSSTSSSGNGDEIVISGYTTIPSTTNLGSRPTSGPAAIDALKPAASRLSSAIDAAGRAASALASNSNPSTGDVSGLASLFAGVVEGQSHNSHPHSGRAVPPTLP